MENRLGKLSSARLLGRLARRSSTVVGVAGLVAGISSPGAAASASQAMPADTVVAISDPGTTLAAPADGRLDGYGFAGDILGAAVGTSLPTAGLRSGSGQRLWVFGLRWTADASYSDNIAGSGTVTQVSAVVIVDGDRIAVPLVQAAPSNSASMPPSVDSGDEFFAASLPAATPNVVVEVSSGGFAQDFSLTHLARQGTAPFALYRQPGAWQTVATENLEHDIPTPYSDGLTDWPDAQMTISIPQAVLSYFGPDGTSDTAPGPAQAWLVPQLTDPLWHNPADGTALNFLTPINPTGLTLSWAGGPAGGAHPTKALAGGPDQGGGGGFGTNDVFADQYAFAVPATLTAATLTVDLPAELASPASYGSATQGQTFPPAAATFNLTMPPPQSPPVPPDVASSPAAIHPLATTSAATGAGRSSGGGFPVGALIAVIAVAVAIAFGALILVRRRHRYTASSGGEVESLATEPPPDTDTTPTVAPTECDGHDPTTADIAEPSLDLDDQVAANGRDRPVDLDPGDTDTPAEEPADLTIEKPPVAVGSNGHDTRPSAVDPTIPDFDDALGGFVAPAPPPLQGMVFSVIGPIQDSGWAEPPERGPLVDLAVYLAAHRSRPMSLAEIRAALAADPETDWALPTVRSNLSRLRKALGPGRLPDAADGKYQIKDVTVDWDNFQHLLAQGEAAERRRDQQQAIDCYGQALALIRGEPFDTPGQYGWVDKEDLRNQIEVATAGTARRVARTAVGGGHTQLAVWAIRQALLANPLDEALAAESLDAANATGVIGAVQSEWTKVVRRLQARKVQPSPELEAHYQKILDHNRRQQRQT